MSGVELPPIVGGRYRALRVIGRGGMGVVYEVEHVHTGERLALKLLAKQSDASGATIERFKREARAPLQIKSENVVKVTDADVASELENAPYVVMELLEGSDLDGLAGDTPQPPERVVEWLRQVARALDKAHRLNIIHRDLKPANVFVTRREDGSTLVKVLDFGIAKMLDAGGAQTTTGQMIGTPLFMSPEQARADVQLTGATDRYALGLIAYRLLFGRTYWRTTAIAQLLNEVLYVPMAPPSERESRLGPAFDAWFARACAREPGDRFPSSAVQVEALASALGIETIAVTNEPGTVDGVASTPRGSMPGPLTPSGTTPRAMSESLEYGPTLQLSTSTVTGARTAPSTTRVTWVAVAVALVSMGVAAGVAIGSRRGEPRFDPPVVVAPGAGSAGVDASVAVAASASASASAPAPASASASAPASAPASASSPRPKLRPPLGRPKPTPSPTPSPSLDPFGDQK